MALLEVKNISKSFGNLKAVDNASFSVPAGSIFGLLGRNGAGKTTTIRMMMNIYLPDSGEVTFRGINAGTDFNSKVGYLPEERGLYKKMKVLETLLFFAEIKGKKGRNVTKLAKDYLKKFDLADRMNSKIEDLSKGNQQKVQFISTLLHDPEVLILDELFSGLDPINTNIMKNIILELKERGKIILFSTHVMSFAEMMCDHIAIIDHGKIKVNGTLADIKAERSHCNISLNYSGDISFLQNNPIIKNISDYGNSVGIKVKEEGQIQQLLKLLVDNNVEVKKFDANDISLEEIFIDTVGEESVEEVKFV
ncbi:MAG: ATP-binding cassette domain-containing protein [Melioribacteraceae bacterium]|nr:ATP-binding cassette domain-containing protein [Melioribacteraceae bacterium]